MEVRCFECAAMVHADGVEAVVDAFFRHGKDSHVWPYPEEAVRNYARNYAEATVRLSGDTERLDVIGSVVVHPVDEARIDDWFDFFDHRGFAGNPDWASCYCLVPHLQTGPEQPERPWRQNRSMMADRLRAGSTQGYLAYVDGHPAGWVNASARSCYSIFKEVDPRGPEQSTVVGVSCFVVAPPYRRHGIAVALLDRVIADAPARGALWIEGYPHHKPEATNAGHFRGPRSMFEGRGFEVVEVMERYSVMRRKVG